MSGSSRRDFNRTVATVVGGTWLGQRLPVARADAPPAGAAEFEIWDLHCHLNGVGELTAHQRAAKLIEYADRMGVDRLVFFLGFPIARDPDPAEMRRQNDQVMSVVEQWQPRLLGFAYVTPNYVEESLSELVRCVRDGPLVGIKLWVARRCHDAVIDPIIQQTAALRAAIYQHTWYKVQGNLAGESTPADLEQLAQRHPQVPLICGHSGGDWELGVRAIRKQPNISIGLGGFDPTAGIVEMAVRELGADRILYGSDIGGRSFASQLAKVLGAEVSDDVKSKILAGNLKAMLRPILQTKGLA